MSVVSVGAGTSVCAVDSLREERVLVGAGTGWVGQTVHGFTPLETVFYEPGRLG